MRSFTIITLLSAFLLIWNNPYNTTSQPHHQTLPEIIKNKEQGFNNTFQNPQNAKILWALLTGEKTGISKKTKRIFNDLELGFLFSPSGMHMAAFLSLILILPRKLKDKKILYILQWVFLIMALFLPYLAMVRISILRILILLQRFLKKRMNIEILFYLTFLISLTIGHLKESPLGFIFSFLFLGTFIALRDYSKLTIIIALFSNQLLISLFSGKEVSLIALIFNLPFIGVFSLLLPFFYFYLLTFSWIHWNWVELFIKFFIITLKWVAQFTHGTFFNSSIFMILAVWIVLLKKRKRYLIIVLFLHGNNANAPSLIKEKYFTSVHYSKNY